MKLLEKISGECYVEENGNVAKRNKENTELAKRYYKLCKSNNISEIRKQ